MSSPQTKTLSDRYTKYVRKSPRSSNEDKRSLSPKYMRVGHRPFS